MITKIYEKDGKFFAETDDFFSNSNGYGYNTVEKLRRAYWWFENNKEEILQKWDRKTLAKMPKF